MTAVSSGSVPKFGIFGEPVTHAGLIILEAPEGAIIISGATKGLLPAMYKVKDFKEVAGVGACHQLLDREGRTPVKDKDIHALAPVKKVEAGGGGDAKKEVGGGGEDSGTAPAPSSTEEGEGATGGGEDGGAGDDAGGGGDDVDGPSSSAEEGKPMARPVSVANTTQCCGGLKSGVCNII